MVSAVLVQAREGQQLLGEGDEAVGLLGGRVDHAPELLAIGVAGRGELELALEDGQRRAQLVAGVRHEGALARACAGQPCQHLVERASQPADLVAGLGERQARIGVVGGDRRRPAAHRLDGAQRAGGQRVAGERRERQRERAADEQRAREHVERVLALGEVGAHDDHAPAPRRPARRAARRLLAAVAHDAPALRRAQLVRAEQRPAGRRRRGHTRPRASTTWAMSPICPAGRAGVRSSAAASPLCAAAATSCARSASASSMPWSMPALVCRNRKAHTMARTTAMAPV